MNHSDIFTNIYHQKTWKVLPWYPESGSGSSAAATQPYRELLTNFISTNGIQSVVDLGCGDWTFSKLIDWSKLNYLGIDVCPDVIAQNNQLYGNDSNIRFACLDVTRHVDTNLPEADLWIMKDVIQHWSNADIVNFFNRLQQRRAFKYLLLTNCGTSGPNVDITTGGFRPINPLAEPIGQYQPKILSTYSNKIVAVISDQPIQGEYSLPAPSNSANCVMM